MKKSDSINPMKKAIILAAGKGNRLGELTKNLPKCLLEACNANSLIDYSLKSLKDAGIKKVTVVVGFEAERLKAYLETKWKKSFNLEFIFNDKYSEFNNIYSALIAKDIWDDETVLLNSDIIYNPKILTSLAMTVKITKGKISYLVIDDGKDLIDEDMKVVIDEENFIRNINKKLHIEESFGEYIGIAFLSGDERKKFIQSLEKLVSLGKTDLYYEDAIAEVVKNGKILPFSTNGLLWTEVDTEEDLNRARLIAKELESTVSI